MCHGSDAWHHVAGPLGCSKGCRKIQCQCDDAGKCLLPEGCDGCIKYGAAGIIW